MENTQEHKKPSTLLKVIVIGIIIILLIAISIGIVRVVPKALNSLAGASLSIGSLLDTRKATTTANVVPISGSMATSSTGGFSIRDLTRIPTSTPNSFIPSPGSPTSTDSTGSIISWNATTSTNSNYNSNSSGSNYAPATSATPNTIGLSDIAVEVISKGIINKTTGVYTPTNTFSTGDMVVVKFKIENRGQYATGVWSARVDMPSTRASERTRLLSNNRSLRAGSAITGEARFNSPTSGTPSVKISIDTTNATQDTNRNNNTISIPLNVSNSYQTNNSPSNPNNNYPIYTGAADLQVRVLRTGTLNQFGQFNANSYARNGEKVAVEFEVANIGGTASGNYAWRTDMTGAITNTYYSPTELSIPAGASTVFIVGMDTLANQNYTGAINFNIVIDTNNSVYELNESNNSANASVNVSY